MENVTRIMVSPDMNFYDTVTHNLVEMILNPMNQMVFITIYRCNKKSPIVTALIKAAKQIPVFVYVEPKASGMHDENKSLAKYLRKEGCHVLCGMKESPNELLKDFCKTRRVHFKACLCIADEATEQMKLQKHFILQEISFFRSGIMQKISLCELTLKKIPTSFVVLADHLMQFSI